MAARNDPEAAVFTIGVIECDHDVRQLVAMSTGVAPIGRVLMPTKSRTLARSFQIDLVRPERDPIEAENAADRCHDTRVFYQIIEDRIEMMEGFDDPNRLRTRSVFELNRRLRSLDVAVSVDLVVRLALGRL